MAKQKLPSIKSVLAAPAPQAGGQEGASGLPSLRSVLGNQGGQLPSLQDVLAGNATPAAPAKEKHGGGLFGAVGHLAAKTGSELYHGAINAPGGLIEAGKAVVEDQRDLTKQALFGGTGRLHNPGRVTNLGKAYGSQLKQDVTHPLRHPGYTALDLLGVLDAGAGVGLRGSAAARAFETGGITDALKAAATKPVPGERTLRVGNLEAHPEASHGNLGRLAQKGTDALLQKAAARKPGGRAEGLLHRKVGKQLTAEAQASERIARGPGQALIALGKKLTPGEQKALQVVAEQTPLDEQITAASARVTGAKDAKARARHQEELDLLHQAKQHLTVSTNGKPALADAKLRKVYDRMATVAGDREELLKSLGQLTDEAVQSRTTNAGRVALGASYQETFLPASHADLEAGQTVRVAGQKTTGKVAEVHGHTSDATATVYYPRFNRSVRVPIARLEVQGKPQIVGAEHFTADENAVRIPDVAEKPKRAASVVGRVGAQGTIGHQRAPGSLTHEYTGQLREHGLRRQDTTRLVGESSVEAAKYAGLRHIHDIVRQAAAATPTRADDIAVRLDNLKGHEKLPADVRKFVSEPEEFFKQSTPHEQASMVDKVRERLFIDPAKLDPQARAEFEKLNEQGKIGWVPRRILGDLAKPQAPLSAVVGSKPVRAVDAINNASRFAILYLKPAYAIPNLLGNAALNVLQQGFAAVPNLKRAAALNSKLGDDVAARIDAAMGEGFALSVSAHGQGRLAGAVDKAAQLWSKGVDTPFRRSSFLYEANKAGFKTPDQITRLVTDPALHDQLVKVSIRANREIIDYSNLTPLEREVVRRVVFFYPWVKGSTVYAGRLLREHPVKAAVTSNLGQRGKQVADRTLGAVPSYLEGIVPFGQDQVVNPNSAAILQTPAVLGATLAGAATGNIPEVAQAANYFTPALALAVAEGLRRNPQTGQAYKGGTNALSVGRDVLGSSLPQVSLYRNVRAALTGQGGSKLYPPSVRSALLQFLVGGVAPRKIDRQDLARLAALEKRDMAAPR